LQALALPPDATLWTRLAPRIDCALERLRTKQRNAVLLGTFLNQRFCFPGEIFGIGLRLRASGGRNRPAPEGKPLTHGFRNT
jgi:hypothetical protein